MDEVWEIQKRLGNDIRGALIAFDSLLKED